MIFERMPRAPLLSTIAVIDALGGSAAVAQLTGRQQNSVGNWRKTKTFPANTYKKMTIALKAKRRSAPDWLWGMEPPPDPPPRVGITKADQPEVA
jgi:hypothetical protein